MEENKFFICERCGNLVGMVHASGAPLICCGQPMTKLEANTKEASFEKHIPDVKIEGNLLKVNVGSVDHPMTKEHYIEWVFVQTDKGAQRKVLNPEEKPYVEFALTNEKPLAVYAYCNLHGLWVKEL